MRIHELIPYEGLDLVIYNSDTGHTVVLTSGGAVFDCMDTSDLRNMSIAYGILFTSDKWRMATTEEVKAFKAKKLDRMLELQWTMPSLDKPQFTVVKGISDNLPMGTIE